MIRRPPRSTPFPTRRSSDLRHQLKSVTISGNDVFATSISGQQYHALKEDGQTVTEIFRHDGDRKSTRLNSSHGYISYAVFCLKKKKINHTQHELIKQDAH